MPFYKEAPCLGGAVGDMLFARGLSLPCSVSLTDMQQERVIEAFTEIVSVGTR
jgi:dTDP-4-amino-4,6-dideoxygalactose transaminase